MLCELCKRNSQHPRMSIVLKDINGTMTAKVCQPCLKKLKNAVKNPKPLNIDIYPVEK